jgi:hypothetical protein
MTRAERVEAWKQEILNLRTGTEFERSRGVYVPEVEKRVAVLSMLIERWS